MEQKNRFETYFKLLAADSAAINNKKAEYATRNRIIKQVLCQRKSIYEMTEVESELKFEECNTFGVFPLQSLFSSKKILFNCSLPFASERI